MTFCFIQAIERGHGATYGSILNSMRTTIRSTGDATGGGPVTSLITMLLTGGSLSSGGLRQVLSQQGWTSCCYTLEVHWRQTKCLVLMSILFFITFAGATTYGWWHVWCLCEAFLSLVVLGNPLSDYFLAAWASCLLVLV